MKTSEATTNVATIEKVKYRRLSRVLCDYTIEKLRGERRFKRETSGTRITRKFRKFMDRFEMMQILY